MKCSLTNDMSIQKQLIRKAVMSRTDAIDISERTAKSLSISQTIIRLPMFSSAQLKGKKISLFQSFRSEVDTGLLLEYIIAGSASAYFPIMVREKIIMAEYDPSQGIKQLKRNAFGIMEPIEFPDHFIPMDIVIIPGVAFDYKGNRIGYGKGYYDRYLEQYPPDAKPLIIAPAFEVQMVQIVPSSAGDVPVDMIITEEKIYDFREQSSPLIEI